ncbi:MAG: hypothetical protein ACYS83_11760 [Planctomycetota bacterium]|jgi:hypothetical protein
MNLQAKRADDLEDAAYRKSRFFYLLILASRSVLQRRLSLGCLEIVLGNLPAAGCWIRAMTVVRQIPAEILYRA